MTEHTHTFDPISGWCTGCIGYRDDGRLINSGGGVYRPGTASQQHELVTDPEVSTT